MKLSKLVYQLPFSHSPVEQEAEIRDIVSDSRQVTPGSLFVALSGGSTDGHLYIPGAIARGAVAVVGTQLVESLPVPYIRVEDSRLVLPHLAAAFYDFPGRKLTVIGVTGTDGKTTTTNLIYAILQTGGYRTGMISTINAVVGEQVLDTGFHVTTPDAPDIQRYLAQMVEAEITHVVLEITSHGLSQFRAEACEFDLAVITNITHEHLDYHGSFEEYRKAKRRLFTGLADTLPKPQGNLRTAILNRDDPSYEFLYQASPGPRISYGFAPEAEIRPEKITQSPDGMNFMVKGMGKQIPIECKLVGDFNISNCLAAIGATVYGLGVSIQSAQKGIASVNLVPGRMENIAMGQDFIAMVDFAHTPNALQQALETARKLTQGRVIAVFGAAGLRDREKRRMMAEKSIELADLTLLTAEDPRTESLDEILVQMADGAVNKGGVEGQTFWRIPDRGTAIRKAISLARPGDLVISCGKGHEQSMCFGVIEYPWDDRTAMRAALAEHLGISGPDMPYLPTQD